MPKKAGLGVLDEFKVEKRNGNKNKITNILVISGVLDSDLLARIVQKGVKNFLTKPFHENMLKEKVKKMLIS